MATSVTVQISSDIEQNLTLAQEPSASAAEIRSNFIQKVGYRSGARESAFGIAEVLDLVEAGQWLDAEFLLEEIGQPILRGRRWTTSWLAMPGSATQGDGAAAVPPRPPLLASSAFSQRACQAAETFFNAVEEREEIFEFEGRAASGPANSPLHGGAGDDGYPRPLNAE